MQELKFLNHDIVRQIAEKFGTPVYVYDENALIDSLKKALAFPNPFGLTVRYSMKALPNSNILKLFDSFGLHLDASSGFEADRAIQIGIDPKKIQITAQEFANNLPQIKPKGVLFVACSINQIEKYGQLFPNTTLGVRINPGLGSGHSNKTNVGGPTASFGIWYEYIPKVHETLKKYNLTVNKLHTHIGSGSDPEIWKKVALISLEIVKKFPDVTILNLGGGFKVGRMAHEKTTDMKSCGEAISDGIIKFFQETGKKLHLEIEPGTFLVALSGALVTEIMDKVDTGMNGYKFLKLNSGMTEVTRPALYGAMHPLTVVPKINRSSQNEKENYMVVGHCCESGDILTPSEGNSEELGPRELDFAEIGDYMVIEGVGAYCSGMSTKNYNSFPESPEVMLTKSGDLKLIRKKQTIDQMIQNEIF